MKPTDFKLHDALSAWLQEHFGFEGMALDSPGLDRIRPLFAPYLSQLKKTKIVTIAGTNGKGETAYRIEQDLVNKNCRVALWTSPHLLSVCERMRFSAQDIDPESCMDSFIRLYEIGSELSYYEFLFLVFIDQCLLEKPDIILLEVGLGGRLDAVNLLDADLSLVCSIGRDHQAILGNSLEKILYEKLGVTRAKKPCLSALESEFLRAKAKAWCTSRDTPYWDAFEHSQLSKSDTYPRRNQVLACAALSVLSDDFEGLDKFVSGSIKSDQLCFPGRREVMTLGMLSFIFIGAHNVDGFRQAVHLWCKQGHPNELWVSFSARARSDLNTCVELMASLPKKVKRVLTKFEHPRAETTQSLIELAQQSNGSIEFESDWKQLISDRTQKSAAPITITVAGSYYFIGAFMRHLLELGAKRS